jgi:acyl-CoA thioester hydrolase
MLGGGCSVRLQGAASVSRKLATRRYCAWPVRVYYEDTDAAGVVYYANYLRYMERARSEWLRALGFEQDVLVREMGVLFAVRSMSVDYLRPARFNDLLEVTAHVEQVGKASLVFAQEVRHAAGDGKPLCVGRVKVACLDAASLRPRPMPASILAEIIGDD